ncbi:MAG: Nif3-like dinuclear metal center hexameric protein, partial [Phycisphaerales bacterium]|nr:Nif3-like dinuclear metal center hexameric protein [Phycisphaerales bacterium]
MSKAKRGAAHTVADLDIALRRLAPYELAADWDNVGLLAGKADWPAARVLVALDLTDAVADEAIAMNASAVVTYHPPIFKGLKNITDKSPGPTSRLPDLLASRVALLATHTALDAAVGGTNDLLLDAFDVVSRTPLEAEPRPSGYKLVVFAPAQELAGLRAALSAAGAGVIGAYSECAFT